MSTTRTRLVALALLGLSAAPATAAEPLAWKFTPGETLHYRRTQDRTLTAGPAGQEAQQHTVRITDVTLVVDRVEPDGSARVSQTIDRIQYEQTAPNRNLRYDTADPNPAPEAAARFGQSLGSLVGASFSFDLSPTGKVSGLTLSDATKATVAGGPAALAQVMTPQTLELLIPTVPLPEGPIEPGREWTDTASFTAPVIGTQTLMTTYRDAGSENQEGRSLRKITGSVDIRSDPPEDTPVKVEEQDLETEVTILFDPAGGELISREDRQTGTMTLGINGRSIHQKIDSTETTRLVPGDAAAD